LAFQIYEELMLIVLLKQFTDHINCKVILVRGFQITGFRSEVVVLCFQIRGFAKSTSGLLVAVSLVFFFVKIHWCPEVARFLKAAQLFPDPIEGTSEEKKVNKSRSPDHRHTLWSSTLGRR
jgi:hypothetical protein